MSYTDPQGQPQGAARHYINKLREILIAEIVAINGYQSHIAHSDIEEINQAWHDIMLDEKKHYGWILSLLRKYDPDQYRQFLEHKKEGAGSKEPLCLETQPDYLYAILNNIREDVKGELEAVVLYEAEFADFPHKDIRTILHAIIVEEKGHAEHLTRLLLKYDPDEYDQLS
jgi:rubrerythrin